VLREPDDGSDELKHAAECFIADGIVVLCLILLHFRFSVYVTLSTET